MYSMEKLFLTVLVVAALLLSSSFQFLNFSLSLKSKLFYACSNMWFISPLSRQPAMGGFFYFSENRLKVVDQGWNEILGGQGAYKFVLRAISRGSKLQYNNTNVFVLLSIFSMVRVFLYFYLSSLKLRAQH